MKQTETNKLREGPTSEEKEKVLKIGRIKFKSAPGPFGFSTTELEQSLKAQLASQSPR